MRAKKLMRVGIIGMTVATMFASAPAAMAKGGVTQRGDCSGAANWKLGLRPEDGGVLRIQLEVENATAGQRWNVRIADNGTQVFQASKNANQFGKFKVRTSTANQAGSDVVTAKATNAVTGQVCNASATL